MTPTQAAVYPAVLALSDQLSASPPFASFWPYVGQATRADRSVQRAAKPHRSSYPNAAVCRASPSLGNQIVVPQTLATRGGEHGINPPAFRGIAPVIPPCGLADILIKVLLANPMMDAVNLPLEQRPEAFNRVGVRRVADVLASGMLDDGMGVLGIETAIADPFIGDQQRAVPDNVLPCEVFERGPVNALGNASDDRAFALDRADDGNFARADTAATGAALADMPVLCLAADEGLVNFHNPAERHFERSGLCSVAEPMKHEPRGLLRDAEIASELRAGDAFLVAGDQPNRDKPLPQRELGIGEDRPDLYREPLPASLALMGALVREVVDFGAAAIGAKRAARPADRAEMLDAG